MRTDRFDLWDEEIFVGDKVRIGFKPYIVRYGNYKHLGVDKIGIYLESMTQTNPIDVMPIVQAKSLVKIKDSEEIHY